MCIGYTSLNKPCPKDAYPLLSIDRLVDGAAGNKVLSFLDAFSGYNQIPMYDRDVGKTTFITEASNYCYQVMPFGLKNAGATYQRLMDWVFKDQVARNMKVYVDDMVVKSGTFDQHLADLEEVFDRLRKFNMRLNTAKCAFGVEGGKFLGFMLTHRGIEANPDKCSAILNTQSPTTLKEVQSLVGKLTSLSRFLPRLAEKIRPIVKTLKKADRFQWSEECEKTFAEIKAAVSSTPILQKPTPGDGLLLYISPSEDAISAALVQQEDQKSVYFVGRALQDAETRYQLTEKVALAVVYAARRLRPYFQSHPVTVKTDYPVEKILLRPELAGRMISWSVELSEFELKFEPRRPIKAQCLTDFVLELQTPEQQIVWTLYVDGSSNSKQCGARVILESPGGLKVEQSLHFNFNASNNQAKYEALIDGLNLAGDMGVKQLRCLTDSQLTVGQINDTFQVKDPLLTRYYQKVSTLLSKFQHAKIQYVPRSKNGRADALSKLALGKKKSRFNTVIQLSLSSPTVSEEDCMNIEMKEG